MESQLSEYFHFTFAFFPFCEVDESDFLLAPAENIVINLLLKLYTLALYLLLDTPVISQNNKI